MAAELEVLCMAKRWNNAIKWIDSCKDLDLKLILNHLLDQAATADDYDTCAFVLQHGAEINHITKEGKTPLHIAIHRNNFRLTALFIKHGADPNAPDKKGIRAYELMTWTELIFPSIYVPLHNDLILTRQANLHMKEETLDIESQVDRLQAKKKLIDLEIQEEKKRLENCMAHRLEVLDEIEKNKIKIQQMKDQIVQDHQRIEMTQMDLQKIRAIIHESRQELKGISAITKEIMLELKKLLAEHHQIKKKLADTEHCIATKCEVIGVIRQFGGIYQQKKNPQITQACLFAIRNMCLKNTNDCKRRLVLSGLQQVLIDILHTFPNSYSIQYTLICEILWELIRHPIILRATTTTTTTTTKGEEEDEEQQQEEQQQMIEKWKTKDLVQGFELVLIQLATDERFEALCEKIFQLLDFLLKNPAICEEKSHLELETSVQALKSKMEQHEVFGTLQEHIQRLIQTEKPTKIVPSPTSIASQKSVEKYRVAQKKSAIGSKEKQYQQQKQQPKVTIAKTDNSPSRETK